MRRIVVPSPRPLSICREAGQGVPLVYLPILCRRSARVCGVAASTVGRHTVGRNPGRQGELVHHGGQQMCQHESPVLSPAPTPARPALWDPCGVSTTAGSGRPRSVARPRQALTPAPGGSHTSSRRPSVCSPFSDREVACKLDSYQADRSLNHPPLSRHSSRPRGHATASGARIPYGKASAASQNLVTRPPRLPRVGAHALIRG